MNLQEIRTKHPEYTDVPDDVLVEALHRKHYKDVPLDVFQEAVGYTPPPKPPGIIERIGKALGRDPEPYPEFELGVPPETMPPMAPGITQPTPQQGTFQEWIKKYGIKDPDDPRHFYDYPAAFEAGVEPTQWRDLPPEAKQKDIEQGRQIPPTGYMWPDEFKREGHPIPPEAEIVPGKRPSGAERGFEPSTMEKLLNAGTAVDRSFVTTIARIPQSIALAAKAIDELLPESMKSYIYSEEDIAGVTDPALREKMKREGDASELASYRLGKTMIDFAEKTFPGNPVLQHSFLAEQLPSAFGSMGGFMLATIATAGVGAPTWLGALLAGASVESSAAYEEAKQYGASEEDAMFTALLHVPLGATEAIPIGRAFKRLDKASGGLIKRALIQAATQGAIEEGLQEGIQQLGSNAIFRAQYDKDRELLEGVGTGVGAGGIVGAVMNLVMAGMGVRMRGPRPTGIAPKEFPPEPPTAEVPPEPPKAEPAEVPAVKEPPVARTLAELREIEKEFPREPRPVQEFPPKVPPKVAPREEITPEAKVEVPGKWTDFKPNEYGYQSREVKGLRKGYFVAQQDKDNAHIIESEVGSTRAAIRRTSKGKWQFLGWWSKPEERPGFHETGYEFETPEKAVKQFNEYQGALENPLSVSLEEYIRYGGKEAIYNRLLEEQKRKPTPPKVEKPPEIGARTKIAERLRKTAEGMTKQIEAKRYPAIGEQRPTARRARIAAGMSKDADRLEVIQSKLTGLADAWEAGTIPDSLKGIKSRAAIEALNWWTEFHKVEPDHWMRPTYDRLVNLGIDTPAKFDQAKKDLAAIGEELPTEPTEKQRIAEKERELIGRKIPGFFTTPKSIAERMVDMADIESGMKVLEPSAGKGNIADVIRDKAEGADLSVVEWVNDLREILELKGHNLVGDDFLEHTEKYDRIIQNPPFEKFQDIEHVRHAYELLKPGGRLISLMSESPFFRSDKKAVEFRDWLEEVGGSSEKLPEGTFKMEATATGVAGRLVTIDKIAEKVPTKEPLEELKVEKIDKGYAEVELRAKKKQWAEGVAPEKIKGGLFEEARKQRPLFKPKVTPPEKAKTFVEWVKRTGGIWDPSLKGEMREFTKEESGVPFIVRKTGKPFDTLVTQAIEDGWLPEGSTGDDLRSMLRQDIAAMKAKGPRMRPFGDLEISKEIEKEMAKAEPETKLDASATEAHDATLSFMGTGQIPKVGEDMVKDILHHTGIKDKDPSGITLTDKDLRNAYIYLQMPDDIRRTFPQFDPVVKAQEAREAKKAALDTYFAEATKPYFSLRGKDIEKVNKVLIEGNLASTDYTDTELEKMFDLSPKQIEGYKTIRGNLDHAGNILIEKMEELEVAKNVVDDFKKRIKGYVPHKWYGDWVQVVKDAKGKTVFMSATNKFDRYVERDRLKKLYPGLDILVIKRTKIRHEVFQQAAPFAVQKMVDLAIEKAKLDPDVGEAMSRALRDLYKSKGFGMHFIKRKGTPGYTEDLARPLAEYFGGFSGYITKMEAIKQFPEALKEIRPDRTPNLYEYATEYINYVTGDPLEFKTMKNLAYFWYLFGNIKSASLNLTQNFVLGWPVLSKETNFALPKLMQAMARTASGTLTKGEKAFIDELEKTGHLDPKLSMEISGLAGGPLTKNIRGLGGKVISLADVFRHAERFNRRSMAVGIYDSGIRDIDRAARLIKDAHFWYGKGNRPILARGPISPLMTFRSWYINYCIFLKNQIKGGEIRPLGKSLFALIMLGGLAALPGWEQAKKAYTKYYGIDPETEGRKVLGKRYARDLIHGMPSEIGVEFSGSVGMGDIIPTNLEELGGVFADIPKRVRKITKDISAGDYKRALEDAAPEALRNPMYAYRLYTRGATGRGGRPILDLKTGKPLKITKGEAIRKGIGYYPIRLAEQYGISETLRTIRDQRMKKKREWADRYRIALLNKDKAEMRKINKERMVYNQEMRKRGRWEDQIRTKEFKQMLQLRERPLGKPPKYMRPKLKKLRKQY